MSRKLRIRRSKAARARLLQKHRPKAGPGALYVEELVSAKTGRELRYRNIGEHPLTLAYARGRISEEQFSAGEEFRKVWEMRALSGRDSTEITPGAAARPDAAFAQSQWDAIRKIGLIRDRLKRRDWVIVEKFCGEGWQMVDAVRAATICHPSGVLQRVQEALDELVEARSRLRTERKSA